MAAVPALAADPAEGTLSKTTPVVSWKGTSTNGGATTIPAVAAGGAAACVSPSCDTFALTLADSDDLTVIADVPDSGGFTMLEVVKPDGTVIYNSGAEGESSTKIKIKKAPAGDYEVHVAANAVDAYDYTASATLGSPQPAGPAPTPGTRAAARR